MCLRPPRVMVVLLRGLTAKARIRYIRLCQFFRRLWCVCACVRLYGCVYLIGACDVNGKIHNSACVYQKWANVYLHIYRPGPFSGKTPVVPSRRLLRPLHNGFRNLVYLLRMQHGHMYAINKNYGASQICTEIPSRSILAKMSSGLDFFAEIASNIART